VGGDAGEQRPRLGGAPAAGEHAGGQNRVEAEAGQGDRVLGHVHDRAQEVGGDRLEALGERPEHAAPARAVGPQAGGGLGDRSVGRATGGPVQRVRVLHLWPAPRESLVSQVEAAGEGGVDGERMSGRALVVDQAGERQLIAAAASAEGVGGLEDLDLDPLGGEGEGGGEPVGPAADDDRACHGAA
jgi:hypothetical protein